MQLIPLFLLLILYGNCYRFVTPPNQQIYFKNNLSITVLDIMDRETDHVKMNIFSNYKIRKDDHTVLQLQLYFRNDSPNEIELDLQFFYLSDGSNYVSAAIRDHSARPEIKIKVPGKGSAYRSLLYFWPEEKAYPNMIATKTFNDLPLKIDARTLTLFQIFGRRGSAYKTQGLPKPVKKD